MLGNVREWCIGMVNTLAVVQQILWEALMAQSVSKEEGGWASHGWGVRSANRVKRHPDIAVFSPMPKTRQRE